LEVENILWFLLNSQNCKRHSKSSVKADIQCIHFLCIIYHKDSNREDFFSCNDPFLGKIVFSADCGCNLSGDKARRNNGELGSQLFGLLNDDLRDRFVGDEDVDVLSWDGIVCWGRFELPAWYIAAGWLNARGLGLLVGDWGPGDGDGVLARGDKGILWTDFLLWGDFKLPLLLCFNPCRELGRQNCDVLLAGEFGVLELGELLVEELAAEDSADHGIAIGRDRDDRTLPWLLSPHDHDLLNADMLWDRPLGGGPDGNTWWSGFFVLSLRNRDLFFFLSTAFSLTIFLREVRRAIFPGWTLLFLTIVWMPDFSSGTVLTLSSFPLLRIIFTTFVCSKLWICSSLTWVMRSPGRKPISYAGPSCSTD
jgi:hypothetical protein